MNTFMSSVQLQANYNLGDDNGQLWTNRCNSAYSGDLNCTYSSICSRERPNRAFSRSTSLIESANERNFNESALQANEIDQTELHQVNGEQTELHQVNGEQTEFNNNNKIKRNQVNGDHNVNMFKKPDLSYIALISQAIQSKPDRKITLKEIYQYIIDTYPYYRFNQSRWQNSVRHNLSLNRCFERLPRSHLESGRVSYWTIRANWDQLNELINHRMKRFMKRNETSSKAQKATVDGQARRTDKQIRMCNGQLRKDGPISVDRVNQQFDDELIDTKMICQSCKQNELQCNLPASNVKTSPNSLKFTIKNLIS